MRKEFGNDDAWADTAEHLAFAASKNKDPQTSLKALAARETVVPNDASSLFLEAISHDALRQNKDAIVSYKEFLAVSNGKFPDQEFEARHRLVALQNEK
jgi:predicted dinucleotide-utilizing enzyme